MIGLSYIGQQLIRPIFYCRSKRSAHASIFNDDFGTGFDLDLGDQLSSGVLILTTSHGFHKVSYELSRPGGGIDFNLELESPLLTSGKAVGKLHLDWDRNDYKIFLSSYREHLVSGSLRYLVYKLFF